MQCLSVCLSVSVTFMDSVEMNKHIFKKNFTAGSDSQTILVFPYPTSRRYSDGDPLTGASNAGGVGRNRDSGPISGSIVCCERLQQQVQ